MIIVTKSLQFIAYNVVPVLGHAAPNGQLVKEFKYDFRSSEKCCSVD